jgi:hypothetical protein
MLKIGVMSEKEEQSEEGQTGSDEMKDGEKVQLVRVDLARVCGQRRQVSHSAR